MAYKNILALFALVSTVALILAGCDPVTNPEHITDPTPHTSYELVWAEEFDGASSTPNPAVWSYDTGYGEYGWGNDEWQNYTDSEANVHVENGELVITAAYDSGNYIAPGKRDGSITSGRITTRGAFSMQYGKVQARIKVPHGAGMWPAFWMLGSNYDDIGWPYCGEIDIMEMSPLYYNDKTTISTIHWWDEGTSSHQSYGSTKVFSQPLSDDYHIYEIEWDENRIVGRIDDMTYMVKTIDADTMSEFYNDFFIILNIAVGGGFGGAPDNTTPWPQSMRVDWVRAYQLEQEPVDTYGIFTDTTPVDDGITPGLDAEIYVWENTLVAAGEPPYEGENVMSFATAGVGWFGAGIEANAPINISSFSDGALNFMVKAPTDMTFEIGMNDAAGNETYVSFPAGQTAWGLTRNGEWGRASIPMSEFDSDISLNSVSYAFMIRNTDGAEGQFAIDDIYLDGGGGTPTSSVAFGADSYLESEGGATVFVIDEAAAGTTVSAVIDNGDASITVNVTLDELGSGSAAIGFGPTDDATDTIAIEAGDVLTVTYTDAGGAILTDTASVTSSGPTAGTFGVFTDTTPVDAGLTITVDAEIYVWENTLQEASEEPYEGDNVIAWATTGAGWFGAGVLADTPLDMSSFSGGLLKCMIKMPADVTFKIGVQDDSGHESWVTFPANTTAFGLERDGQWGRASIPIDEFSAVNLDETTYAFTILEESGTQCAFAIDDIYWEESTGFSSVDFDAPSYDVSETGAGIAVADDNAAGAASRVTVDNGDESIQIDFTFDSAGEAGLALNFGPTDDATNTIAIETGDMLTVRYTNALGDDLTDTASITGGPQSDGVGVYSETYTSDILSYGLIVNSADWSGNSAAPDEESTAVTPVDGTYVLAVEFTDLGAGWGGVAFDFGGAGQDATGCASLVFHINASAMEDVTQFGIKFEDTGGGETEVNITGYTPEINGDWARYEIPLSAFSSVDFSSLRYLGLWNPTSSGGAFQFGTLYFDNIYLTLDTTR